MVNAQEWLDREYPKEKRGNVIKLDIESKDLKGELDLRDFFNLRKLNCSNNKLTNLNLNGLRILRVINCHNNYLTSLDYSSLKNPKELTILNVIDNNFSAQDLFNFNRFVNLRILA